MAKRLLVVTQHFYPENFRINDIVQGFLADGIAQAVETAVAMNENGDLGIPVPVYTEDVSTKVVKIIQSYVGVVNKMVWRKS